MINDDGQVSAQLATMIVDLDSIFDTRLGTLAKFGFVEYQEAQLGGFFKRPSDHFRGIDPIKYEKLYKERDQDTLAMSGITHVVSLLRDFVGRVNTAAVTAPIQKTPRIDINMYPYDISENAQKLIESGLRTLIQDRFDLGFVRYSMSDLHYDLVKFTYDHMVMYNIGEWITAQAEDWEKRNRAHPELTAFIPVLAHSRDQKEIPEDVSSMADEFERHMAPLINIIHMPVMIFSQIANPFTENYKMIAPEAEASEVDQDEKKVD